MGKGKWVNGRARFQGPDGVNSLGFAKCQSVISNLLSCSVLLNNTHPQGGRVQVPISSGVVSKDAVTFSGQNQFPMGSLEVTFHGKVADTSLTGTADMTSRSLLISPQTNTASLNLRKQ